MDSKLLHLVIRRVVRSRVTVCLDGPLIQKGRSRRLIDQYQESVREQLARLGWACRPRAKLSVGLSFFSKRTQPPSLLNLTKCYLDVLQGSAYKDDRQVRHLCATLRRGRGKAEDGRVFINVQTLRDYNTALDVYYGSCFNEHVFGDYGSIDFDEPPPRSSFDSVELYEVFKRRYLTDVQNSVLVERPFGPLDRPGGTVDVELYRRSPLSFDLGRLPTAGESLVFGNQIRAKIKEFKSAGKVFDRVQVPLGLEIKIASSANVDKDLDNVGLGVATAFNSEYESDIKIDSFRAYVVWDREVGESPRVLARLIHPESISKFEKLVFSSIEDLEDRL